MASDLGEPKLQVLTTAQEDIREKTGGREYGLSTLTACANDRVDLPTVFALPEQAHYNRAAFITQER